MDNSCPNVRPTHARKFLKLRHIIFLIFTIVIVVRNYVIVVGQESPISAPVLVVLNKAGNDLAIVDPVAMNVRARIPVGEGPHEVVLSEDGKTAFVANYGARMPGNTISVIDIPSAKEARRVNLGALLRPHGLQLIQGKLYFTAELNRVIARYDPAANMIDMILGTGQDLSHMIVGSRDQRKFFTTNISAGTVSFFEFAGVPPNGSKLTQIPVGRQPEALDLSPDGKELWVGLNLDEAIDIVDTSTGKVTERVKTGGRPYRVKFSPDGKRVITTIFQTKEVIIHAADTRQEVKRIRLESTPFGLTLSADGKTAFITAQQPDMVLKLDLESGEVLGRVETGKSPDGIALSGM